VQARIDALPRLPEPPPPLPAALVWALVGLVEGLKLLGFWVLAKPAIAANAGATLAAMRWRKAA
jgi:hypothetical protein